MAVRLRLRARPPDACVARTGHEAAARSERLAQGLFAAYDVASDVVSATLARLFDAGGDAELAASFSARTRIGTDVDVVLVARVAAAAGRAAGRPARAAAGGGGARRGGPGALSRRPVRRRPRVRAGGARACAGSERGPGLGALLRGLVRGQPPAVRRGPPEPRRGGGRGVANAGRARAGGRRHPRTRQRRLRRGRATRPRGAATRRCSRVRRRLGDRDGRGARAGGAGLRGPPSR